VAGDTGIGGPHSVDRLWAQRCGNGGGESIAGKYRTGQERRISSSPSMLVKWVLDDDKRTMNISLMMNIVLHDETWDWRRLNTIVAVVGLASHHERGLRSAQTSHP